VIRPTTGELRSVLGRSYAAWAALTAFIHMRMRVQEEWHAGADGWTLRLRRGGRSLLTLTTGDRHARALFVVPPSRVRAALALPLAPSTRAMIRRARPYPDGRWIALTIRTLHDLADLKTLVLFNAQAAPSGRRSRAA
jgi:hypothetical protein